MSRIPILYNFFERFMFAFMFIAAFIFPISVFIANALLKVALSVPVLGAFVLKWTGGTLSVTQSLIIALSFLIIINIALSNFESRLNFWIKGIAHARGIRVAAKIINVKVLYYEGQRGFRTPVVRFDFEIEHEGKTAHISTIEYGQTGPFDVSIYPAGTKVSAKYDPSTGTMTCIDQNGSIIAYV